MWDLSLGKNFVVIGPEVFFSSPSLLLPSSFGSANLWKKFWLTKKTGGELCLLVGLPALLHLHPPLPPSSHQPGDSLSGTAQKQVPTVKSMNWGICTNISRGETRKILKKLQHLAKLSDPEKKIRWNVKLQGSHKKDPRSSSRRPAIWLSACLGLFLPCFYSQPLPQQFVIAIKR